MFTAVKRMALGNYALYLIRQAEALQHQRAAIPEWSHDAPFQFHTVCIPLLDVTLVGRPSSLDIARGQHHCHSVIGPCTPSLRVEYLARQRHFLALHTPGSPF